MTILDLSLDNFFGEGVSTDINIAIAQTRSVFESVPAAGRRHRAELPGVDARCWHRGPPFG